MYRVTTLTIARQRSKNGQESTLAKAKHEVMAEERSEEGAVKNVGLG